MEKQIETILSLELPYRATLKLQRSVYQGGDGPRVAIISGIYGDELEGLYLCHRLAAWLEELNRAHPKALLGRIELYPALNPLGLETLQRTVPVYNSDLNHCFPGHPQGLLHQRIAAAVMTHLESTALVIDARAGDIFTCEIPQVRILERFTDTLLSFAKRLNTEFVWIQREVATVLQASLAFNLNQRGIPCLAIAMGTGIALNPAFIEQIRIGILTVWRDLGVLAPDLVLPEPCYNPLIVSDDRVYHLNAQTAGMFVPSVGQGTRMNHDQLLGSIVSPFAGDRLAEIRAPVSGKLLSLRHYPLIYEGSLLARIVKMPPME